MTGGARLSLSSYAFQYGTLATCSSLTQDTLPADWVIFAV